MERIVRSPEVVAAAAAAAVAACATRAPLVRALDNFILRDAIVVGNVCGLRTRTGGMKRVDPARSTRIEKRRRRWWKEADERSPFSDLAVVDFGRRKKKTTDCGDRHHACIEAPLGISNGNLVPISSVIYLPF